MLLPTTEEFVALCRAQVTLLTESLGAVLSVVYLTEELAEAADAKLMPIVAYPEAAASWEAEQVMALLSRSRAGNPASQRLLSAEAAFHEGIPALPGADTPPIAATLLRQQQIVIPLIHEGVVMGLLVTARADRPWNSQESAEIEQIAKTLANACVLDQRAQWLEQELRQQRLLQDQQHEVFDDLLHQFRNPLTALRTFGKLLVRRLLPTDANRDVASGIVRESDRLEDLLKRFDAAIDWETQLEARLQDKPIRMPLLPDTNFLTGAILKLEPHTVSEVLKPLLVAVTAIAQERNLILRVDLPQFLPLVQTDLKALREVLSNLLDNALKYTPTGGTVAVRAGLQSNSRSRQGVAIVDTGPGIPAEDLKHLFERHYRGVQATTEIPGTGLGLAIARDLIHQMQGEIQVFSPAAESGLVGLTSGVTPGTAFIVWLPESLPDLKK